MENKMYCLPIETPDGIVKLEINHTVANKTDEDMSVTLSTTIQGETRSYQAETTEKALILLAKNLPERWHIKSCISCRYGHFCPVGNFDNELFCVTDFEPKEPCDLWHVTEDEGERKIRSRTLFDSCDHYKEQSEDYFTYSDYYYRDEMKIHGVKREWSHPFFCMKKHYCPYCNERLEKTKTETVVNSKSEEAKNYDFSNGDGFMVGNIKFIRTAFRCNKCDKTYSIKELIEIERMRQLNEQRVYTHIDTDDSVLSLHDCYANRIQFKNGILSFYFPNGFWVTPPHRANNSSETVRTDFSQVDYHIDDDVSVYVFRNNIFKKTIRTEWTLDELVRLINNNTFSLEFLYQYKNYNEQLLKCWLHFDKKPYHYECQLEIPTSKIVYRWNVSPK